MQKSKRMSRLCEPGSELRKARSLDRNGFAPILRVLTESDWRRYGVFDSHQPKIIVWRYTCAHLILSFAIFIVSLSSIERASARSATLTMKNGGQILGGIVYDFHGDEYETTNPRTYQYIRLNEFEIIRMQQPSKCQNNLCLTIIRNYEDSCINAYLFTENLYSIPDQQFDFDVIYVDFLNRDRSINTSIGVHGCSIIFLKSKK